MDFEDKSSRKYCMRSKHVAIICGVVIAVGLILGLGLGLGLKPQACNLPEENGQVSTTPEPGTPTQGTGAPMPEEKNPCPALDDNSGDWRNFRLPAYIYPTHYDLEIKPEMEVDRYTGTVIISIQLVNTTRHLWLHLRETVITEMPLLQKSSGPSIALRQCFEYKSQEYVVVEAEEDLLPTDETNFYRLTMKFQGHLNGSLVGFYRTTYMEDGKIK